jgi:hypothetical protein
VVTHRALIFLLLAGPVQAQSLRVVSEFQRVNPFGEVVAVDRTPRPREILSPGVARNAFASFQIAATVPEREPFFVYIQTNPPDIFEISLYEELYSKTGAGWIPDALEPVKLPAFGTLPYLPLPIAGQNTVSYWLDVWVPAQTAVGRVRLEVLLKIGQGWVMCPMEVRVLAAVAPSVAARHAALPPVEARADVSVYGPWRHFLCNRREPGREERLSVRRMIHRNAAQDLALARVLEGGGRVEMRAEMLRRVGVPDLKRWCGSGLAMGAQESEWFLRVRDWLYRQASAGPE